MRKLIHKKKVKPIYPLILIIVIITSAFIVTGQGDNVLPYFFKALSPLRMAVLSLKPLL